MDIEVFDALAERMKAIEEKAEDLFARQQDVGLKRWLDNQEVCQALGISLRTLQKYRERGVIPYSRIRHKIYYRPEDVEELLQSSHHPIT